MVANKMCLIFNYFRLLNFILSKWADYSTFIYKFILSSWIVMWNTNFKESSLKKKESGLMQLVYNVS